MDKIQAVHDFWSGFGWPAYDESTVPSSDLAPDMPRITYNVEMSEFDDAVSVSASLWDMSYSWERITKKAEEIYDYLGNGGVVKPFNMGYLWVNRGSPFYTRMGDPDDRIRRIVINIEIDYFDA